MGKVVYFSSQENSISIYMELVGIQLRDQCMACPEDKILSISPLDIKPVQSQRLTSNLLKEQKRNQ